MQGAAQRQHGTQHRDYRREAVDLLGATIRDLHAARAALQFARGPVAARAADEVTVMGMQLARLAEATERLSAAMETHDVALFLRGQEEAAEQRAEAEAVALAPVRALPRHRAPSEERALRSVPAWAVPLLAAAGAAGRAMRAHARAAATGGVAAVVTAGTMTSLVVLTPHTSPAPVPQRSVLVPVAASPVSPAPAVLSHRTRRRVYAPLPGRPVRVRQHATPSASPSPLASPGHLLVSPLGTGAGGTDLLTLTAQDGTVHWIVQATGAVTISQDGGTLTAGQSVTLVVHAAGEGTITVDPGDIAVPVRP